MNDVQLKYLLTFNIRKSSITHNKYNVEIIISKYYQLIWHWWTISSLITGSNYISHSIHSPEDIIISRNFAPTTVIEPYRYDQIFTESEQIWGKIIYRTEQAINSIPASTEPKAGAINLTVYWTPEILVSLCWIRHYRPKKKLMLHLIQHTNFIQINSSFRLISINLVLWQYETRYSWISIKILFYCVPLIPCAIYVI